MSELLEFGQTYQTYAECEFNKCFHTQILKIIYSHKLYDNFQILKFI